MRPPRTSARRTPTRWRPTARSCARTRRDDLAEAAEARLEELEFTEAKKLHTVLAYKSFLETYPDGAQARARRERCWRACASTRRRRRARWRPGGSSWPSTRTGAQRDEAKRLLAESEQKDLATSEDPKRLSAFLREAGDDPRRQEVEGRLDDQAFAQAKASGAAKLFAYLRDFPAGKHREAAKARLLELEVEGLLVSGLLEEAEARVKTHPLGPQLKEFPDRLARARAVREALASREPLAQAAHVGHYLRDLEDLQRALGAAGSAGSLAGGGGAGPARLGARAGAAAHRVPHRAQPAHPPAGAGEPAERAPGAASRGGRVRSGRAAGEPARAREQPGGVPGHRGAAGSDAATWSRRPRSTSGRTTPNQADPVVLRRWVQIRQERRQPFSAAVAARQLSLWSLQVAREEVLSTEGGVPLASARQMCAAVENARFAADVIAQTRKQSTEFPEDLNSFERVAADAVKLSQARLADAELLLREQQPGRAPVRGPRGARAAGQRGEGAHGGAGGGGREAAEARPGAAGAGEGSGSIPQVRAVAAAGCACGARTRISLPAAALESRVHGHAYLHAQGRTGLRSPRCGSTTRRC